MVDRQDIDALLISALYGELTPADEARLQTHLDSHPADRTALADLTFARNAVRESRILTVQLEPPQAVSAMLLQEASRRAPKPTPVREKEEGWFARFVRSFVAHPAMAAAAMLVLVLGVAGTLYMRGDGTPVQPRLSPPAAEPSVAVSGEMEGTGAGKDQAESDQLRAQAGSAYEATLADDKSVATPADTAEAKLAKGNKVDEKPEPAKKAPAPPRRAGDTYITVPKEPLRPMDLETADARDRLKERGVKQEAQLDRGGDATSGRRFGIGSAATPKPDPVPAPSTATASPDNQNRQRNAPQVAAPPPSSAPGGAGGTIAAEEKNDVAKADAGNEDTWARETHGKVVAAVKANNCREATNLAVSLESRAPGYYAQNVQNDRQLKQCVTYINAEREREAERVQRARAQQRRSSDEATPPRAAPKPSSTTNKQ